MITWAQTKPGVQTAINGSREARLTKSDGGMWYAEGHLDLQWEWISIGADRDVLAIKTAAEAWLTGPDEWRRFQAMQNELADRAGFSIDIVEQDMIEKAFDTIRQPAKK